MRAVDEMLNRFTCRVLGGPLPADLIERFRANTIALAGVLGIIAGMAFELEFRLLGERWTTAGTWPSVGAMLAVILAHRRHRRLLLTLNLLLTVFFALTTYYTWYLGGVKSPAVWWLFALPYVAVTCAAPRSAACWSAVGALTVVLFCALEMAGVQLPAPPNTRWLPVMYAISVLLLSAQLIGFLSLLDRARTATTRDLQRSNVELVAARDQALAAAHAKAVFLANMSHEIRTPLNGVLGMAELLQQSALDSTQQRFVHTLRDSGEHLMHVINDVLDFSKLEARRVELERIAFSPREIVERVVEAMSVEAERKRLALSCAIDRDVPARVLGDPSRVRQILFNLTANAIKFTSSGSVGVRLTRVAGDNPARQALCFEVTDTGIGIATNDLPRLFTAFAQADESTTRVFGGTGLGLAISQELARLMQGEITVESTLGKGSRFACTLQFDICQQLPVARPETPTPQRAGAVQRVLLVEDNAVNREVGTAMLEQLGCLVDVAIDGADGLRAWLAGNYDVVLMDCQMPVMDGYAAARAMREEERLRGLPRTPIVALTANAFREDREACLEAGMDDFLSKPYTLPQLRELLANHAPAAAAA